jgi:tetratricopeptide (TPR) repeat protein
VGVSPSAWQTAFAERRYDTAFAAARDEIEALRSAGNLQDLTKTAEGAGKAFRDIERFDLALPFYEDAAFVLQIGGRSADLGWVLYNLGICLVITGDKQEGYESFVDARNIAREIGDERLLGVSLQAIGQAFIDLGDYERALEASTEALKHDESAALLYNLGLIHARLGDAKRGAAYYRAAAAKFGPIPVAATKELWSHIRDLAETPELAELKEFVSANTAKP